MKPMSNVIKTSHNVSASIGLVSMFLLMGLLIYGFVYLEDENVNLWKILSFIVLGLFGICTGYVTFIKWRFDVT